ncbi:SMAD/FHA domain-containing protein, partial [Xylona heveae TC161]
MPSLRLVPHQDPRSARPSLTFTSISRTLPSASSVIRVGRYSDREGSVNPAPNVPSDAPVGFKSKVVSRKHCEFWCANGRWHIKDVGSSSGTFLNHIRLSQPNLESRPFPVNDGDIVQLGIDFRGGEEMIFRCVKMRVECNRGWQKSLNNFNVTTHKRLRNLSKGLTKKDGDTASTHSSECAICLMSIAPCQSLFVAPCSHVWHYKCIRPILSGSNWPQFLCPNCRAVADLEADV